MAELGPTIGSISPELVMLALDMAAQKHLAIAQNIANANDANYRPVAVNFDDRLAFYRERLVDRRFDAAASRILDSLRTLVATEGAQPDNTAGKVQLDAEMAKLTRNALWYEAMLTAYGKSTSIMRMAISEGRG